MSLGGLPHLRGSPIALYSGDVPTLLRSDPRRGGDGMVRLNPDKQRVSWGWIAAELNGQFPFDVPANAMRRASATIGAQGDKLAGDFEVQSLLFRSTARCAVTPEVRTPTLNRILSNVDIDSTLLSGTSQLPGMLNQSILCLPKTAWFFNVTDLSGSTNTISPVLFGRRFEDCGKGFRERLHRRADMLRWVHPLWIGPQDPAEPLYTGPQVTLAAGRSVTLTFPIPSSCDMLLQGIGDACTYADGTGEGALGLYCDVYENASKRSLINLASEFATGSTNMGLDFQQFVSSPTVDVTGFPGGTIRSFSLRSPRGCYDMLIPRNTQIMMRFTSTEASNAIILRVALFGLAIYGDQPPDRDTATDGQAIREREAQAREFLDRLGDRGDPVFATGPRNGVEA